MGYDAFEELLNQYGRLTRKLLEAEMELHRVHEFLRVEGVYTYTSSNRRIWSEVHDKIADLAEVNEELSEMIHRILGINESCTPG